MTTDKATDTEKQAAVGVQVEPIVSTVTVCDACLKASCWQGEFMCDDARSAGTVEKTIKELKELNLEHYSYWREC
jgi:hypothetical protein